MTTDAIYKKRSRSHWLQQVSAVETTQWLQCDQTLPLTVKGVACATRKGCGRFNEGFAINITSDLWLFSAILKKFSNQRMSQG